MPVMPFPIPSSLSEAEDLDRQDPLAATIEQFILPEGTIYMDGNSLGPLSRPAQAAADQALRQEWGEKLIASWVDADWINLPKRIGAQIAPLIGAQPDEVICADSTSINIYKLAAAALAGLPTRCKIVTEAGNFPTDIYMLQGLVAAQGGTLELAIVPREQIIQAIDDRTAVVLLTHSHYVTAETFDIASMTKAAHDKGALILWDLSHSTGILDIDLNAAGADFATGCGYKYLNGGPGAPSFAYVHRRHHASLAAPLAGWMGHTAPFDFSPDYAPASGVQRLQVGTPYILSMSAMHGALSIYKDIDLRDIFKKSRTMSQLILERLRSMDLGLTLLSPDAPANRGGHVAYQHDQAYAIVQALIAQGIVGDFREPNAMRFAPAPLYTRYADVWKMTEQMAQIMRDRTYAHPQFQTRRYVP